MRRENPDVIINIVDATNLSRSLFFTTQLLELGIPVVVALNKSDLNRKKETVINTKLLSDKLGCAVVETTSTTADGLRAVVEKAAAAAGGTQSAPYHQGDVDLTDKAAVEAADRRRFDFVNRIVEEVQTRKVLTQTKNFNDKIDDILTNRWLGIPIFAVVMFLVFQISQTYLGTWIAEGVELSDGTFIPGLVPLLEGFQGWVGGLLEGASPFLYALLVDGVIGGVIAVVDVQEETDKKEVPPCMILKSDGAALYDTTDLATLVEREEDYKPDEVIYVVDKRQELHFTQVFRCAKKTGIVRSETELKFLGFGTMNGKDGKPFKTREGGVMRLENLIREIDEEMYRKIMDNRTVEEGEAERTSQIVGLAAIKYGDLSNQASKDYVFDVDRFTSFEGNTGPYILYTIVRIKSILNKYQESGGNLEGLKILPAVNEYEKALMLQVLKFNDVFEAVYDETAPHKLCAYIYELANEFNKFYHETKILSEEDEEKKSGYIALLVLARRVLEACIDLLGFEAPERM